MTYQTPMTVDEWLEVGCALKRGPLGETLTLMARGMTKPRGAEPGEEAFEAYRTYDDASVWGGFSSWKKLTPLHRAAWARAERRIRETDPVRITAVAYRDARAARLGPEPSESRAEMDAARNALFAAIDAAEGGE